MSYTSSNQLVNPNAREAMDKFKMEAASEVGVNLKNGYNGDLTSRQAGSVGGQMVNIILPKSFKDLRQPRNRRELHIQYFSLTYKTEYNQERPFPRIKRS